jgi:hypothetical protein
MNIKHPTRNHNENKPMKVFLMKDGELIEASSMGEASRLLGCASSQVSRAYRLGRKVHGYTISDRHPMDDIMQEIEQRNRQPYQISK